MADGGEEMRMRVELSSTAITAVELHVLQWFQCTAVLAVILVNIAV